MKLSNIEVGGWGSNLWIEHLSLYLVDQTQSSHPMCEDTKEIQKKEFELPEKFHDLSYY